MSRASIRGVSAQEIEKFRVLQQQWWNPSGPLRSLHLFNPVRVRYIAQALQQYGKTSHLSEQEREKDKLGASPFLSPSVSVLDVGCGGGILSESLARLGATVQGIDMCEESVIVADQRREARQELVKAQDDWSRRVTYAATSLFNVVAEEKGSRVMPRAYDVVVASEVIEHVSDARGFLSALCQATKPGGLLILSTMDKTVKTFLSHIGLAEQLTGVVTPGTHDWVKFIPPQDMTTFCARPGNDVRNVDLQYILTYPDVCQSIAARNFEINFTLSRRINTGHYLWAGVKAPKATANASQPSASSPAHK